MPRPKRKTAKPRRKRAAAPAVRPVPPIPMTRRMLDLIIGYWTSQLVHVAAKLKLADLLKDGAKTPAALARATGVDEQRLFRVMRALASVGVFKEGKDGRFALTPLAATLRGDRPDSMRDFALMMVERYNYDPWSRLIDAVREPRLPFHDVYGVPVFEYLAAHPEDAEIFGRSMTSISGTENPAVAAAYDFSRFEVLVDVGGSHGHLLSAILKKNRKLKGLLFDQPHVLEQARKAPYINAADVAGRIETRGGSFFESVPAADAYIMKYILHDWDDDASVTILTQCRRALAPGGKVLVVDNVIPPGNGPHWGKLLDINMLALTGGRERTKDEFRQLFAKAGLKMTRVVPTACPLSIVEGETA